VSPTDEAVIALERQHPDWMIWTVPTWDGLKRGTVWCARRRDNEQIVINAGSPEALAEYIGNEGWPG